MNLPASELAWRLADYLEAGVEPPSRCVSTPGLTEGEMMTTDEVEQFIIDSIATLRILSDHDSPRVDEVITNYQADLAYLLEVGSLTENDYNELIRPDNLQF
jgi:hypothetical protein